MSLLRRLFTATTATALALGAAVSVAPSADASSPYPIQPNIAAGIGQALQGPDAPAAGMNVAGCRLTAAHPYPVLLVNGTFSVMRDDFGALAPILANDGYCVEGLNFGGTPGALVQAIGPVATSAQQVAGAIDAARAKYGVSKVDLVGHSQGGALAEYVTKNLGYASKVHSVVALSPTTHGTTLSGLAYLAQAIPGANEIVRTACPACRDQENDSAIIKDLDNGPIAQPGVQYTVIETRNESVVTPVGSAFIKEPGVHNTYVQDACVFDSVDHADLSYDNTTIRLVLNALSPSTAKAPNCWQTFPYPAIQQ